MLKQRIITASLLIPAFLALIVWAPSSVIAGLFLGVMLLGAWEWARLIQLSTTAQRLGYLLLLTAICFFSLYADILLGMGLLAVIFWSVISFALWAFHTHPDWITRLKCWSELFSGRWKVLAGLVGLMVLVPAWSSLVFLGQQTQGRVWILSVFLLVWAADIAAYFCGRAWGKCKLSLVLSPGKSWEGVLGGMACVFIVALMLAFSLLSDVQNGLMLVLLCLLVSVVSVVGDLFQSLLKRISGVKDSGQLLPGHGGVLDRIDSITAAAPVFAVGLYFLGLFHGCTA